MKRSIGKERKQNKVNKSVKTSSLNEVKVLLFPDSTCSPAKKELTTPLQAKSDTKLASSDSNNDGGLEEKSESNQDLEVGSSLNRLEETEKKLKYHIRELESFLGLS